MYTKFTVPPPTPSELQTAMVVTQLISDARRAEKKLKRSMRDLDSIIDRIEPDFAEGIIANHIKVIEVAKQIIDRLRIIA
jgi:hypothetical protein